MNRVFCGSIVLLSVVVLGVAVRTANATTLTQMDSADFTWKYEMNASPSTENQKGASAADMDYYTKASGSWVGPASFDGTVNGDGTTTLPDHRAQYFSDAANPDHVWNGVNGATGWTMELKMMSHQSTTPDGDRTAADALGFFGGTSAGFNGAMLVGDNGLWWGQYGAGPNKDATLLNGENNSGAMHVFRLAQLPGEDSFTVWRDDVVISEGLTTVASAAGANAYMCLVELGGYDWGPSQIDYLRIVPGAYAPVGEIVPEPTSLAIMVTGVIGLLAYAWRKRK